MHEWLLYLGCLVVASLAFAAAEWRRRREQRRVIDASVDVITPPINGPGADA